jgi:hypothetical protein
MGSRALVGTDSRKEEKQRAMPPNSGQHTRTHRAHSSFFGNSKPPPLIPSLLVGAVFLFALLFVTVPNWGEFSHNISQFPTLWQVSSNRREHIFSGDQSVLATAARSDRRGLLLVVVHDQGVSETGGTA